MNKKKVSDNNAHKNNHVVPVELPKASEHIIVEIVEYVENAVMSRTILKKLTGNVTAMSFSEGEELSDKRIPFDTYIQIIDGAADINIDDKSYHLGLGSGIIIPAHSLHRFDASQKFKILSTIIKNGYED
jgi:quercetin dioxygenase-like cupin family protein